MRAEKIDLLLWYDQTPVPKNWLLGDQFSIPDGIENAVQQIMDFAQKSNADYLLFWRSAQTFPEQAILQQLIAEDLDVAHCGLAQGMGKTLKDLCLLGFSWDKLDASADIVSTSWRVGLDSCLVRRELFLAIGGFDPVFRSKTGIGLEFGYRCLKLGALVEHQPDLYIHSLFEQELELEPYDFYCFVLRHYSLIWAKYVYWRRMMRMTNWVHEWQSWQLALKACQLNPVEWAIDRPWQPISTYIIPIVTENSQVSVIIPTLGRYEYLPDALTSLRQQSVKPAEVIVVDQNPPDARQPEIYRKYEDLNLRVFWQDERGQSLARNTGMAAAKGQYVFLFDDDSIAAPDLLERHLEPILSGRLDISTGVAFPPPPTNYVLPQEFRHPRLAQTFDTGNALLSLDLARKMGGLDRNYDFGPGTDADFGTRLYLAGYRILHNPHAVRVHFKALAGGLRVHGAHKYNSDVGLLQPYPPVTQSYYALRYLNSRQAWEAVWLGYFLNKFPKELRKPGQSFLKKLGALVQFMLGLVVLPIKRWRSLRQAHQLLNRGIRLERFEIPGSTDRAT